MNIASLNKSSHWFTNQNEEVFFDVELNRVPRVRNNFVVKFKAHRYVARSYDENNVGHNVWTNWRILRDYSTVLPLGVGPKTRTAIEAVAEPAIEAWLASPEYT